MKVRILLDEDEGINYWLWCPACNEAVRINMSWQFNGDMDSPSFAPSILTEGPGGRCHSFLTGGVWSFLSDCTHAMAGLSVPMVDLPDWLAAGAPGG